MASLKIEPEIILMQLERGYETLDERVKSIEDVQKEPDFCDCNCADGELEALTRSFDDRVATLEAHDARDRSHMEDVLKRLDRLEESLSELNALVRGLEAR